MNKMAKWKWMKKDRTVFWKDCPACQTLGGMHLDIQKKKWICDCCGYEEDEERLRLMQKTLDGEFAEVILEC